MVRTSFDYPPIPLRCLDWSAWIDGEEESGPVGHGSTELEALLDLLAEIECRSPAVLDEPAQQNTEATT